MLHTIENEDLICVIESNGAEIRSLKNKANGQEYIWQINPSIWGSSSPVLFPAIGKIKENKIRFQGKDYSMPKHGIIRNNEQLIFTQLTKNKCAFTLENSVETEQKYPYKFSFIVSYFLMDNRLIMKYDIINKDSGPIHFACGGHTAYACPLNEKTKLSDYVVEFPNQLNLQASTLGASGLLSDNERPINCEDKTLQLSDNLFDDDALIFEDIPCNWVRLRKKEEQNGIIVKFTGYPHLALWSKPGADYLCIEPWLGLPDKETESIDINDKSTLKAIEPNQTFSIEIETVIEK